MGDVADLRSTWNALDEAMGSGPSAFESFFEEQKERLLRTLSVITGSKAEAEDLAQEAFAVIAPETTFDRAAASAAPIVDSFELQTR